MTVRVGQANGLAGSQPYVKIYLSKDQKDLHATKQKTLVARSADPSFNQYFTLKIPLRTPMDGTGHVHVTVGIGLECCNTVCLSLSPRYSSFLMMSLLCMVSRPSHAPASWLIYLHVDMGCPECGLQVWDHARMQPNECLGGMAFSFAELASYGLLSLPTLTGQGRQAERLVPRAVVRRGQGAPRGCAR